MVVYLPIAFIKDWICSLVRKRSCKSEKSAAIIDESSSAELRSPLNCIGGHKVFAMELEGTLNKKNSEPDLAAQEEGEPLVPKHKNDADTLKQHKELTTREIAAYGFYIAPIWFFTEVSNSRI